MQWQDATRRIFTALLIISQKDGGTHFLAFVVHLLEALTNILKKMIRKGKPTLVQGEDTREAQLQLYQ